MKIIENIKSDLLTHKNINIVFVGDSITSTEWVHPNWREMVEYVLKEELTTSLKRDLPDEIDVWKIPSWGIRCFNCGFDGSSIKDILKMVNSRILPLKPNIVIYMENPNGIIDKIQPEDYKNYILELLKYFSSCNFVILTNGVCGINKKYNNQIYRNAQELKKIRFNKRVIFVNSHNEFSKLNLNALFTFKRPINEPPFYKKGDTDYVHPNALGNAYIAKIILEKGFSIKFNPEKYMKELKEGIMYPGY